MTEQVDRTTYILSLVNAMHSRFPYDDCLYLMGEGVAAGILRPGAERDLIPDLALYFANIVGFASSVDHCHAWSQERTRDARRAIANSFFEDHPEYDDLAHLITESDTPELARDLALCDELRRVLHETLRS